eukprot:gene4985-5643_t
MLLDSGATICCLAKRCFTSSPNLHNLSVKPYSGPGIMSANGSLLKPYGLVNLPTTIVRRVSLHQQPIVKVLLHHCQDLGLIEHIDSPYLAATLLVEKKNVANSAHVTDRYRVVGDYRFLNNALTDSGWPAPSLQQCLDSVTGSTFVSSIDFNSGYHQVPCTDHCKPLLAFSPGYGFGQWTWTVMPQGIKPASNHFQKTMEQTFSNLSDCILPPFFNDVVIKGISFQEHLCNIRRVLTKLREAGLTLNALKCRFFQTKLPYLGHIIDCDQIRLDSARAQSLVEFPAPRTVRKLKVVLGMAQFCDRFLSHYSEIASPLHHLTEINAPFHWTPECDTAFNTINHLLTNAPLVRAPESRDFFVLETDASDKEEGVCLKARSYADGKEYIANSTSQKPSGTSLKKKHTQSSLPLRSFAITFLESHSCSALTIVLTPTFNQNDRQNAENFSTGPLNYPNSITKFNIFHQRTM